MRFGLNFFPTVGPDEKDAATYYDECLALTVLAEELGYHHVKTVEHYFFPYGGYSPDPVTFLAAAAARTSRIRIATGAAIPAFSHPVKLAGKLAMLDNLSHGRLDVGFGRAFLPDEFEAFGISMDSSRARFDEGVEICRRLWTEENVVVDGEFHRFGPVTMLPRPYQRPHPPIMVATAATPESCENAGRNGFNLMLVPSILPAERAREMLAAYRAAWAESGREPGTEQVQLSYNCYVAEDGDLAHRRGREFIGDYVAKLVDAVASWKHTRSDAYRGYERIVEQVKAIDFDASVAENKVLAGNPDQVAAQVAEIRSWFGDAILSLQVNSGPTPIGESVRTVRLMAEHVAPTVRSAADGPLLTHA